MFNSAPNPKYTFHTQLTLYTLKGGLKSFYFAPSWRTEDVVTLHFVFCFLNSHLSSPEGAECGGASLLCTASGITPPLQEIKL